MKRYRKILKANKYGIILNKIKVYTLKHNLENIKVDLMSNLMITKPPLVIFVKYHSLFQ